MNDSVLGIAYAGSKEEYESESNLTLLEQKINNAIGNELKLIQVRTNDVMEYYKMYGGERLVAYLNQVFSEGLEVSVHLPSPVPDKSNPLEFNDYLREVAQGVKILSMAGVTKYTIHPHYNRLNYVNMIAEDKEKMLNNMGSVFAKLVAMTGGNIVLAIENVPVRSIEDIEIKENDDAKVIEKKKKAIKNISYGMTPGEMRKIIDITRETLQKTNPEIDALYSVGMTFDTGHATSKTPEELKMEEIEKWITMFEKDIRIFHIAPRGEHNLEQTGELTQNVYNEIKNRNMQAVAVVENHYSFEVNNKIANFCKNIESKVNSNTENKERSEGLTLKRTKEDNSSGHVNVVILSIITCLVEVLTFLIVYNLLK